MVLFTRETNVDRGIFYENENADEMRWDNELENCYRRNQKILFYHVILFTTFITDEKNLNKILKWNKEDVFDLYRRK